MGKTEFDLPLLQRLLLSAEVVDISVREVVCLREEGVRTLVYNPLRSQVELMVRVAQRGRVEDMVVVAPVVEPYELRSDQGLDLLCRGVDQTLTRGCSALLVADDEQVREHFDVKEIDLTISYWSYSILRIVLELHLLNQLQTICRVVSRLHSKRDDGVPRIRDVVRQITLISSIKDLLDKLYRWLGSGMDLLTEVPSNQLAKAFLRLYHFLPNHFCWLSR